MGLRPLRRMFSVLMIGYRSEERPMESTDRHGDGKTLEARGRPSSFRAAVSQKRRPGPSRRPMGMSTQMISALDARTSENVRIVGAEAVTVFPRM